MAGNPANISRTEMDFLGLVLEYIHESIVGIDHVSATGMHHTFWLSGRTGSVEDEKRVFSIHGLGGAIWVTGGFHLAYLIFPPYITSFDHAHC